MLAKERKYRIKTDKKSENYLDFDAETILQDAWDEEGIDLNLDPDIFFDRFPTDNCCYTGALRQSKREDIRQVVQELIRDYNK